MARIDVSKIVNRLLARHGQVSSGRLSAEAGISRQAAHAHLARRVERGELHRQGEGRGTVYVRAAPAQVRRRYGCAGLAEDRVWSELEDLVRSMVGSAAGLAAARYGFQEMLNNAIEHSKSRSVDVLFERIEHGVAFEVVDRGVGIFQNLQAAIGLDSPLEAIQELSKGKLTTDPKQHSGEGIFFTSKVATRFEIESGTARWIVDWPRHDHTITPAPRRHGTRVRFERGDSDARTLESVFREHAEDFDFDRTRIVVKLFELGTPFVSRSEARRMLARLSEFREVVLDFRGVEGVGQGFADEVFRVWARDHPATTLVPVDMNEAVTFMVERARRAARHV